MNKVWWSIPQPSVKRWLYIERCGILQEMERNEEGSTEGEEKYKQTIQEFEDSGVTEVKRVEKYTKRWN